MVGCPTLPNPKIRIQSHSFGGILTSKVAAVAIFLTERFHLKIPKIKASEICVCVFMWSASPTGTSHAKN